MAAAVEAVLPADAAVMAAAVADWRVTPASEKLKKGKGPPELAWTQTVDILASLGASAQRPGLLIGFAAETGEAVTEAQAKLARKGCDWIVANNVAADPMGGEANQVTIVSAAGAEAWERLPKSEIGRRLAERIAKALEGAGNAGVAAA
jgi:phosphopantothenoylcysteine decarboxylase/phosphopantothenate--cysteine ligase